jgi:hypothetical protein
LQTRPSSGEEADLTDNSTNNTDWKKNYIDTIQSYLDKIEDLGRIKEQYPIIKGMLKEPIERIYQAGPGDVQKIAASQLELMSGYHQIALIQSRRSFFWALVSASVGLIFFMGAIGFVLHTGNALAAVIPVISGAVVEVIAGIMFFLYGKTTTQLSDFHRRLEVLQRYLLANSICESLEGDERNKTRAELIREIMRVAPITPSASKIVEDSVTLRNSPSA